MRKLTKETKMRCCCGFGIHEVRFNRFRSTRGKAGTTHQIHIAVATAEAAASTSAVAYAFVIFLSEPLHIAQRHS